MAVIAAALKIKDNELAKAKILSKGNVPLSSLEQQFQRGRVEYNCPFSLSALLPHGSKDIRSYGIAQENRVTKGIAFRPEDQERHTRKLEITKEIMIEELGNMTT